MKTEKEKMYEKAIKMVEGMLAEGVGLTKARQAVAVKTGICYPKMVRLTKHLRKVNSDR